MLPPGIDMLAGETRPAPRSGEERPPADAGERAVRIYRLAFYLTLTFAEDPAWLAFWFC